MITCFLMTCAAAVPAKAAVRELDQAVAEAEIPAMAVCIVDPDGIVWSETWGAARLETPFLLGSLSKSFTALCIMQLVEEGRIDLDASILNYLPDAHADVTVRQLLNHTSGFGTYQTLTDYEPASEPGTHVYANVNYALLGKIIESVSGLTYAEYLEGNVLEPLGMLQTSADPGDIETSGLVQDYENWFGVPVPAEPAFPDKNSWIQPSAGYIASSASDMSRYLQMYLRGGETILSQKGIMAMIEDSVSVDAQIPYSYGMGWTLIEDALSEPVWRHSGLVETGMSCMYILPEQRLGVILLADMNDYLVGTDLMDRMGWNLVMSITGDSPGTITRGEYISSHAAYDLLFGALIALGALPFLFLRRFRDEAHTLNASRTARVLLLFFGVPAALLSIPPLLLGTPLWVVRAFVPDLFFSLWICAAMLAAGGVIRIVLMIRRRQPEASTSI